MQYKVMMCHGRKSESLCAQFKEISDARLFIEHKVAAEAALKTNVIYRLYDFDELISEHDPASVQHEGKGQASSQSGSQGHGSGATFRPTPFNMSPRPGGVPHKWNKYEDDDEKK